MPNPSFFTSLAQRPPGSPVSPLATENFESYSTGSITPAGLTGYSGFAGAPTGYGSGSLSIGSRSMPDGTSKYLAINSNELVWPLSVGSSWSHLRIGILAQVNASADTPSGSQFMLVACHGQTHPWGQSPCANAIGANMSGRDLTGWILHGPVTFLGASYPYFYANGGFGFFKNVAGTITNFLSHSNPDSTFAQAGGGNARRTPWFVDIVKGSPNWTVTAYAPSTTVTGDVTKAQFETALQHVDTGSGVNAGAGMMYSPGAITAAFDETAGGIDSLNLYWNESVEIEIYEIGAYKFS